MCWFQSCLYRSLSNEHSISPRAPPSSVHPSDESNHTEYDPSRDELVKVQVGPQHFELLKLIGEGGYGKVILVKNHLDGELYAMKVISKKLLAKKNHVSYMKSEREILTKISSPFVVSLRFAFHTETKLFLVMDFLGGGELFFHLRRRGLILEREACFYFGEMILAIEFLHSVNIIHR